MQRGHARTSMKGRVVFWYRLRRQGDQLIAEVLFKLYGQQCNTCYEWCEGVSSCKHSNYTKQRLVNYCLILVSSEFPTSFVVLRRVRERHADSALASVQHILRCQEAGRSAPSTATRTTHEFSRSHPLPSMLRWSMRPLIHCISML